MYSGSQHSIVYNELYILRMRRSREHQNIKSTLNKERKQLLIIYTMSHYSNTHIHILSPRRSWKETMRCTRTEITFHSDFKRRTFSFSHTDIYVLVPIQSYTFLPVSTCSWTITSKRMCWQLRRVVMGSGFKCQVHTKTN